MNKITEETGLTQLEIEALQHHGGCVCCGKDPHSGHYGGDPNTWLPVCFPCYADGLLAAWIKNTKAAHSRYEKTTS